MMNQTDKQHTGTVAGINGPVVDVEFGKGELPKIREALYVTVENEKRIMEVAQHVGGGLVRCIMLGASEGMFRGMEVVSTGAPISVPVGQPVLGRLFNVLGDSMDSGEPLPEDVERRSIYRPAPEYSERKTAE